MTLYLSKFGFNANGQIAFGARLANGRSVIGRADVDPRGVEEP